MRNPGRYGFLVVVFWIMMRLISSGVYAQNSCPPTGQWFDCSNTSIGQTALDEMVPGQSYQGQTGGLYGNWQNSPPAGHLNKALTAASQIQPINGKIVLMSIGMSNTNQEFTAFMAQANNDSGVSDSIVLVNGAQPTQTADRWAKNEVVWERIPFPPGIGPGDVQVIWLKLSDYPSDFANFQQNIMTVITQKLPEYGYANVKLIYVSSRIYAGYTLCLLNPEPLSYETGFVMQKVVLDQINDTSDGGITYSNAPVILWGPYLWADGTKANSKGISWSCNNNLNSSQMDYQADGTHPSAAGEAKVGAALLNFFKTNTTSKDWFTGEGGSTSPPPSGDVDGDLNGDGLVNIDDFLKLVAEFVSRSYSIFDLNLVATHFGS